MADYFKHYVAEMKADIVKMESSIEIRDPTEVTTTMLHQLHLALQRAPIHCFTR